MVKQKEEKSALFGGNSSSSKNKKARKRYGQEREDAKRILPRNLAKNHETEITLTWHNLTAVLKPKRKFGTKSLSNEKPKCIIRNVSGVAEAGDFLAIMGLSGSGKTTLLNVLTNRNVRSFDIMGKVKLNGHVVGDAVMHHCAYIQQDDLLCRFLTVREHLIFQAMLRMDKNLSSEERMLRVQNAIYELSLSDCADTKTGIPGSVVGISGGERRRLSLAIELLTNPSIIFCDEPTSGLDSYSAMNVVTVLQQLSKNGRTVIFTVHQPPSEVYELFDKIILMALGRVAYMGSKEGAISFFESMKLQLPGNFIPADFFMYNLAIIPYKEQECIDKINMICDIFETEGRGNQYCKVTDVPEVFRYKATWSQQMKVLSWRSSLQLRSECKAILMGFTISAFITSVTVLIFGRQQLDQKGILNMNGILLIYFIQASQQPFFLALNRFCRDIPLFFREHKNGMYRADTYFLSTTIFDLPVGLITTILCIILTYHATGLNSESSAFWICVLTMVLTANASLSLGYMISCLCNSYTAAAIVGSNSMMLLYIFCGFMINNDTIPEFISWIKYFSHFYYGYEILLINQWRNIGNITCEADAVSCIHDGKGVLERLNSDMSELLEHFIGLTGLIVFYRILALLVFYVKSRRNS